MPVLNISGATRSLYSKTVWNGSTIWFLGESGSLLSVSFPGGTQIISAKGIDNVSIMTSYLSGRFTGANEHINTTGSEGGTGNTGVTDSESANKNISAIDNESDGAEGVEITHIISKVQPTQNNLLNEPEENGSPTPISTEIPFPGLILCYYW